MKKAIIYARVSTLAQDYDRQVSDLTIFASGNGYNVEAVFTEKISGAKKNFERPQLMAALNYSIENNATILVSELSRLGRNTDELLKTVLICKDSRVNVYFQKENISVYGNEGEENPFFMVMLSTLAVCASLERSAIRHRMESGYKYYRANGGKVGRKEGYRYSLNDYEKKYPALVNDLKEKAKGARGTLYSVRALAERHKVNPSTVQAIAKLLSNL